MNIIGLVFAGVIVMIMGFFGIGAIQSLHDGSAVIEGDVMYDDYNTATDVSIQTFTMISFIPLLIFIVAILGTLLLFFKLKLA